MATSGGNSGAIHASANANAGGGSNAGNPRKFAEKIQILNIKGAEETSEFEKIMQECAAVRAGRGPTNTSSQIIEGPKVLLYIIKRVIYQYKLSLIIR